MFFLLGKSSLIEFALLFSITGVISLVLFLLSFFAGKRFMQKAIQKRWVHKVVLTIWAIFIITITGFISSKVRNVPVPVFPDYNVSAAGTVRTSPAELTKFMLELANPQYLSAEMSQYLRMPQIKLSDDLSWGMGPGILYTDKGYALWQWGQHIDFQSIMVVFPDNGSGVVVCTNNDLLNPDVALEIAERAIGKEIEPLRAAIHLEYDYSD
jgi:CubicO group peptidase (beta-lactamase class C family)